MRWLSIGLVSILFASFGASSSASQDRVARAEAMFTEGVRAYEEGRLDEAVRAFEQAYEHSRQPELAFNIARVYERMGDPPRAIRWFRRYLDQSPQLGEHERQDIVARIASMEELARRMREQVMTVPPNEDELTQEGRVFFERGVAMFRRRRYDAALAAFTAAYRFAPLPEVVYNIAVASERTNRFQDAIDYYREYLRQRPNGSDHAWVEHHIAELRSRSE